MGHPNRRRTPPRMGRRRRVRPATSACTSLRRFAEAKIDIDANELVQAYFTIDSPQLRRRVLSYIRDLADEQR